MIETLVWVAVIIVLAPLLIEAVVMVVGAFILLCVGAGTLLSHLVIRPRKRKETRK